MNIRQLIETYKGNLTNADQKVLSVLLSNPMQSAYLGVNQIAEKAGVHATSVVRVAKKLGFGGYPEMRQKLRDGLSSNTSAERVKKRLAKMDQGSILSALIASEIDALQAIPEQITQAQIDKAAGLIRHSGRILVFGIGHPSHLADLMARRLNRSSYPARSMHHIDWETPDLIMALKPGDVFFAIFTQSLPAGIGELMSLLADKGVVSIVVSDVVGTFLRPKPEVLLAASRGREGESQSLTVPMAICNTLILEISKQDGGRSVESLQHLAKVRWEFAESSPGFSQKPPKD